MKRNTHEFEHSFLHILLRSPNCDPLVLLFYLSRYLKNNLVLVGNIKIVLEAYVR
jgi:hypothetical protein